MFTDLGGMLFLPLIALALDIVGLVQVWTSANRSIAARIAWTLLIGFFPLIGGIGWYVNWGLDKLVRRVNEWNASFQR